MSKDETAGNMSKNTKVEKYSPGWHLIEARLVAPASELVEARVERSCITARNRSSRRESANELDY